MSQPAARNVFIAIPMRSPQVTADTMTSLVASIFELGGAGIAMTFFTWSGDPLIAHARNLILATFLQSDCTDLLFLDDDVSWEPGTIVKFVTQPVDMVAGIYPHKKEPESYPLNLFDPDLSKLQMSKSTGLMLVADVPFGFCRLSRACVQKMWDDAEDRPFRHQSAPDVPCRVIFEDRYEGPKEGETDGQFYGEDYSFCQRWRELGGQVWVDPNLTLGHTGWKKFTGTVGDFLRRGARPAANPNDPAVMREVFRNVAKTLRESGVDIKAA